MSSTYCAARVDVAILLNEQNFNGYKNMSVAEVATDPDQTRISLFFLVSESDPGSLEDADPDLILLITFNCFKLIVDICQNIR